MLLSLFSCPVQDSAVVRTWATNDERIDFEQCGQRPDPGSQIFLAVYLTIIHAIGRSQSTTNRIVQDSMNWSDRFKVFLHCNSFVRACYQVARLPAVELVLVTACIDRCVQWILFLVVKIGLWISFVSFEFPLNHVKTTFWFRSKIFHDKCLPKMGRKGNF